MAFKMIFLNDNIFHTAQSLLSKKWRHFLAPTIDNSSGQYVIVRALPSWGLWHKKLYLRHQASATQFCKDMSPIIDGGSFDV